MTDIKSLLPAELEAALKDMGEPAWRAKQIFRWLHRGAESFAEMSDLGKSLQDKLGKEFYITVPEVARKQISGEDGTVKYLWRLRDGNAVESVVMRYKYGNTVCVSSQVGCRMGCAFCASAHGGRLRDLAASEILDQVIFAQRDGNIKISHIVMMGIGEPLDNFENVMTFLKLINAPEGVNIGMRHISLSTCGLPEMIDKLATYNLQLTLSLSLHAPDDETRKSLMPMARKYSVEEVVSACERYFAVTGRRVSLEYAMIDGVNDSERQALLLAGIARRISAHINLIPLNKIEGSKFMPSRRTKQFMKTLEAQGANATLRRRLGGDIDAACGQLRKKDGAAAI